MTVELDHDIARFIRSVADNNGLSYRGYTNGLLEKAVLLERAEATETSADESAPAVPLTRTNVPSLHTLYQQRPLPWEVKPLIVKGQVGLFDAKGHLLVAAFDSHQPLLSTLAYIANHTI